MCLPAPFAWKFRYSLIINLFMYVEVSILYFNCLCMYMMKTWFAYNLKHMATCAFTPVIPSFLFFCICVCASVLKQLIRTPYFPNSCGNKFRRSRRSSPISTICSSFVNWVSLIKHGTMRVTSVDLVRESGQTYWSCVCV